MEHIKNTSFNNTTKLIGIKDLNIKISIVLCSVTIDVRLLEVKKKIP